MAVGIGMSQLKFRGVGNTQHLQRVIIHPAFNILVGDAMNVYRSVGPLERGGRIVIGQMGERDFYRDELIFIVLLPVEAGFQPVRSPLFQDTGEQPITHPVE